MQLQLFERHLCPPDGPLQHASYEKSFALVRRNGHAECVHLLPGAMTLSMNLKGMIQGTTISPKITIIIFLINLIDSD